MVSSSSSAPRVVENQAELIRICETLGAEGAFALDTEFVRERTFFIQLGIIQVAASEIEAVLDPQALESLSPLYQLVADPSVEKIVHAGEQDFAAFYEEAEVVPQNVFDTQVASALVGYGDQISYQKLVAKVTGVTLSKLETLTDWTARPLTRAQIDYSLEDVRYLLEVRRHLGERLSGLGREGWEREECRRLEQEETYRPPAPEEYYRRLKTGGLNGARLGVLKEIAAWREVQARSRNIPRSWVLRDQSLVEIARRRPNSIKSLRQIRSMKPQQIQKDGETILTTVKRGLENPLAEEPRSGPFLKAPPQVEPMARLLEAWLYARAAEAEIAPSMLATRDQLKGLAAMHLRGELDADGMDTLDLLTGWRRELVGQDLLDLLEGKKGLSLEPGSGKIRADVR